VVEMRKRTGHIILYLGWVCAGLENHACRSLQGYITVSCPFTVNIQRDLLWAASSKASALGKPIITPPSAIASKNIHANAGPDPDSAVHASKCFSSRNRQRPMEEKILRIMERSSSMEVDNGKVLTTVIPSRIYRNKHKYSEKNLGGDVTDFTRGVGHCPDDLGRGKNPGCHLRNRDSSQNADQKFAIQGLFDSISTKYGSCKLRFTAVTNKIMSEKI
jgi:hypothetical protein